jgi:GTP-binding protein LepA
MNNTRNFASLRNILTTEKVPLPTDFIQLTTIMQHIALDVMGLEREKGITIKSHAIQITYPYKGENYVILI